MNTPEQSVLIDKFLDSLDYRAMKILEDLLSSSNPLDISWEMLYNLKDRVIIADRGKCIKIVR